MFIKSARRNFQIVWIDWGSMIIFDSESIISQSRSANFGGTVVTVSTIQSYVDFWAPGSETTQ